MRINKTAVSRICWAIVTSAGLMQGLSNGNEHKRSLTINGRVIDNQSRPVEDATVVYYEYIDKLNQYNYKPVEYAQTTSDGRFSFKLTKRNPSPLLVAYKQGLALGWSHIINHISELSPTIRLGSPTCYKGIIVDENGRPVRAAKVRICMKNRMLAKYTQIAPKVPKAWFTTRTDAHGQFVFDEIPDGTTADFNVEAPGRASIWTFSYGLGEGERFEAGRTDLRIELPPEACIKGRVIDELTGRGIADVNVVVAPQHRVGTHLRLDLVQTDPNGRFELNKLAPDTYLLCAMADGKGGGRITLNVEAGKTIRNVAIPLRGVPLEVIVYNAEKGTPLENAKVIAIQEEAITYYTTFKQTAITDSNGTVHLYPPPGECEITIFEDNYGSIFQPVRLLLDPGKPQRHEVFVPRTACILAGEIVDERGRPLSGATVMEMGFGPHALTDANGYFDTSHVQYHMSRLPARIRVLARHELTGLGVIGVLEDPNQSGRPYGQIILKPAYTLIGRVTNPTGTSITGACVRLLQGPNHIVVKEVFTDPNGVYRIRSVPDPGDKVRDAFTIESSAEGFGRTVVNYIPFHDDVNRPVYLNPIILEPADRILSGVVVDANDQPVAGAVVKVESSDKIQPSRKSLTDARGWFCISDLCKGSLKIEAWTSSERQPRGTARAQAGHKNVRIVLGQNLIFSRTLIGESLPNLENIKIDFHPEQAEGKMILVCFWDMNQHPSRRCILELSKQTEHLNQNDVTIVAVQTSKIDGKNLDEWVKKSNIPFPVGFVQGEEETRFSWGVRSLPWLVLTDSQHVVRAEGFGISDLDEKLR